MARPKTRKKSAAQVAKAKGFSSGLEDKVSGELNALRVSYTYEEHKIAYTVPARPAKYTPDFVLPNGIIVETKGHFVAADRQKHLLIKDQFPELDIRFVFADPNTFLAGQKVSEFRTWLAKEHGLSPLPRTIPAAIKERYQPEFFSTLKSKPSQTTYAIWCQTHGFQYAGLSIPLEWINEAPTAGRLEAIQALHTISKKKANRK